MLHLDFETRSPIDLKKRGAFVYAPQAEIICACWAIDDGPVECWDALADPAPRVLTDALETETVWAHNAQFEYLILQHSKVLPSVPLDRMRCTAVLARGLGLPSSLDDVARCLGLPAQKDKMGAGLIQKMCVLPYSETPTLKKQMAAYCRQDVIVERMIHSVIPDTINWDHYVTSEIVNVNGVMIDTNLASRAADMLAVEKEAIKTKFARLCPFGSPASIKFTEWVHGRLEKADQEEMCGWMEVERVNKVTREKQPGLTLGKDTVEALLERPDDLPGNLAELLELKRDYARSSASKFATMLARASDDDRVRGAFVFLGASKTGRFASRGLQLHNMPRDKVDEPLDYIDGIKPLTLDVLPALIRPALMPAEGNLFVCSDWVGVEARALPWLASTTDRNRRIRELMRMFRDGEDIYVDEARNIYHTQDIDGAKRQVGKVAVLSLGYGGSVGAFKAMAKGYGVTLEEAEIVRIVQAWRGANTWAVRFWRQLMASALAATQAPDTVHPAGRVSFERRGDVLYCRLPSGRELAYLQIRIEDPEEEWMGPQLSSIKASLKPAADTPDAEWPRERLWGGLIAENVTQATCADLLMRAMQRTLGWLGSGVPGMLIGHTHDELLLEVEEDSADFAARELARTMVDAPNWAEGLPLAVEQWTGDYYRK